MTYFVVYGRYAAAAFPLAFCFWYILIISQIFMFSLKARIEAAKKDLSFFSLYWDDIQNTDWISDEELEEGINDCLDDLNDAQDKLNENGSPPWGGYFFSNI